MKTKLLLLFISIASLCDAQIVNIPDLNFKNALINTMCVDADLDGIYESDADLNNDGQIQNSEASVVQRLKVSNNSIASLSGLSSFYNLEILICDNNLLTELDLTAFSGFGALSDLEYLDCSHNALASLNLYPSGHELDNLTEVNCSFNQLTSLDISYAPLVTLNISNNNLSAYSQTYGNYNTLVVLNISNNQFTSFTVNHPSLASFYYTNNPILTLTYDRYSNTPIVVSNLNSLQNLYFNYISVPSISLLQLPNLNFLKVNHTTIQADVILTDLPALNSIDFASNTNLTLLSNLGFTELVSGFSGPNTIMIEASNFHISGNTSITNINIAGFSVDNFSIENMPNLTSLKFPDCNDLETISLSSMPQLQYLEIGSTYTTLNPNCIDLTIQNFNNLDTILIKQINLGNLVLNSLPSLTYFTNNGTSCNTATSSFTLSGLPILHTAKLLDKNLSILNIYNLNSLYDLEIYSTKLSSLDMYILPQLYQFEYTSKMEFCSTSLPMLTIQSLPNLHSVYLSRLNNGGLNLNNLPQLHSFIVTNDYPGIQYNPQTIDYSISDLPNLFYVQLDEIITTNLSFSNLANLNTIKMRESEIGDSFSFHDLTLQRVIIDYMPTLRNLSFNNLPNFKNLGITGCPIQSLNLGNTNASLESFVLTSMILPGKSLQTLSFVNFPQLDSLTTCYSLTNLELSNLPNLTFLNCSSNKLNSITLTDFPQLNEVICMSNQPSTNKFPLILNLPVLTKLNVNYNNEKLADLDLSNCPLINELHYLLFNYTTEGNIPYMNLKNGNPGFSFMESNPINNLCVDSDEEMALLQSLNANLSNTIFTTYCNFNPGGTFYTIQGNSLLDLNTNGCDSNDVVFPNINLNITSGSITSSYFANDSGYYSIPLIAGQYTITPTFENPAYYSFSPSSINVDFPTQTSPLIQDFCITPIGDHNDLAITLLPYIPARPGFDAEYHLIYSNKGNQTQSGSIILTFNDSILDYVSCNPMYLNQSTNLINWSFSNLQPFESRIITITLNVNSPTEIPAVVSGDILNYVAEIIGSPDEYTNDNISILDQTAVNSFDPNDITCLEGKIVLPVVIGEYVHYMIRFQNTGTGNAQNIAIKDILDLSKFDITTLIPIYGSHSFTTRITDSNQVEFIFEDINLPFTTGQNDGYICFKIKTKPNLVLGDVFSNQAKIYFDYNYPIITNNYTTTIQLPVGIIKNELRNEISVFPNPVSDLLIFETQENVLKIEIFDFSGRLLSFNTVTENRIDLSKLETGQYILKIYTVKGMMTTTIMKQ